MQKKIKAKAYCGTEIPAKNNDGNKSRKRVFLENENVRDWLHPIAEKRNKSNAFGTDIIPGKRNDYNKNRKMVFHQYADVGDGPKMFSERKKELNMEQMTLTCEKERLQTAQTKGFSPVWTRLCVVKWEF